MAAQCQDRPAVRQTATLPVSSSARAAGSSPTLAASRHPRASPLTSSFALACRAAKNGQSKCGEVVTDFSGWIYSLYKLQKDLSSLARGRAVERELVRRFVPAPDKSGWELLYNGIQQPKPPSKIISSLLVNGAPLRGMPDFVFREKESGRIVIVEVKASNREVPSDGWPNLRAQLWAYVKIDDWVDAPQVLLVGEVWGFSSDRIFLQETIRWDRDDVTFQRQNQELFDLYCDCRQSGNA